MAESTTKTRNSGVSKPLPPNWSIREGLVELVTGGISYWAGSTTEATKLEEKIKATEKQRDIDRYCHDFQKEQWTRKQAEQLSVR